MVFLLICSSVSVNTGHNTFPVNSILISMKVIASNACFLSLLLLLLRDFLKYLRFFYICIFYRIFVFFLIYNINRRIHSLCNFSQKNIGLWHVLIASYGDKNKLFSNFS